jgi:pilus assembly protein CpaE
VEFLADLYRTLRLTNDYVIVDTPPGFTPEVIASIDASSHVCMIGMLDALALKNTKLGLETLELMGYDTTRINLVLNRADSDVGVRSQDVLEIVGRVPDVLIPSHRDIARSTNAGKPIALSQPRSDAARGFGALAELYLADRTPPQSGSAPDSQGKPKPKPKRRRSLLFGRRSK